MEKSSFQFSNPDLTKCVFKVNKKFKGTGKVNLGTKFSVAIGEINEEKRQCFVELSIVSGSDTEESPFYSDITMMAKFMWSENTSKEQLDTFLNVNAPALLLGYIRPIIANLTNSSRFPVYNIPFINFTKTECEEKK